MSEVQIDGRDAETTDLLSSYQLLIKAGNCPKSSSINISKVSDPTQKARVHRVRMKTPTIWYQLNSPKKKIKDNVDGLLAGWLGFGSLR